MATKNWATIIPVVVKIIVIPSFWSGSPRSVGLKSIRMAIPSTISGKAMGMAKILLIRVFRGNEYLLNEYAVGIANSITKAAEISEVLMVSCIA